MTAGQLAITFDVPTTGSLVDFFYALELESRAFLEQEMGAGAPEYSLHSDKDEQFYRQFELAPLLDVIEGQPRAIFMHFERHDLLASPVELVEIRCYRYSSDHPVKLTISFKGGPIVELATFRDVTRAHFLKLLERMAGTSAIAGHDSVSGGGGSATGTTAATASVFDRLDQSPRAGASRIPRVFISYTHDSPEHKEWVASLARRLNSLAIWLLFDQWDVELGGDLPQFMETGITESDRVLVICTSAYNDKANGGRGGAGYEKMIMTAALMQDQTTTRIIPLVRGSHRPATPTFLSSRRYIDFTNDDTFDDSLVELSRALLAPGSQRPLFGA